MEDRDKTLFDIFMDTTLDEKALAEYYGKGLQEAYDIRDRLQKDLNKANAIIKRLQHMKNRKISQAKAAGSGKANYMWRKNPRWAKTM